MTRYSEHSQSQLTWHSHFTKLGFGFSWLVLRVAANFTYKVQGCGQPPELITGQSAALTGVTVTVIIVVDYIIYVFMKPSSLLML